MLFQGFMNLSLRLGFQANLAGANLRKKSILYNKS